MEKNPFSISFGKKPYQYIERDLIIDEIIDEISSDIIQNQCFMLTGVRGSGKTVTMTTIENRFREDDDFIVVGLNPERDMLKSLVAKLYDSKSSLKGFFDSEINLSAFGIGVSIKNVSPIADIESALEVILKELKKKGKRLLVTVDEVYNTPCIREFASTFQLLIRQELPIFLIMAGLYENIHNIEDEKNLTFLYRAPKYFMEPLEFNEVKQSYIEILGVAQKDAGDMAKLTKGYPFAYQALGKYLWDAPKHKLSDAVIQKFDKALATYVYNKIWDEMSEKDRWYMNFISKKETMKTSELLELSGQNKSQFSQYRVRLSDKGIIDTSKRGLISIKLPRFAEFVKNKIELEI
ncbi:MAG: ATP-binding protein [Lachnospiraceae bacterium]|nr:ATP-binding protein [Lachnospiraceae bacterium]